MKKLLKNQSGVAIVAIILVIVLAAGGGGAAFLTVRMVVSGDGNFLQPFEELGWIEAKEDDSSEDKEDKKTSKEDKKDDEDNDDGKDEEKDESKTDSKKEDKKASTQKTNTSKYLVDEKLLSDASKKSGVEHYYGELSLSDEMGGSNSQYADLYKLMKAGVNLYAKDGKVIEIAFGFDITDFCKKAFEQYPSDFSVAGISSADGLQEMMMAMIETTFDSMGEEYSDFVTKFSEGGVLQIYITEKGFEKLYDTYEIEEGDNDVDTFIEALEESFKTKIKLVK